MTTMRRLFLLATIVVGFSFQARAQGLDTLQLKTIFHEPYLAVVRPSFQSFSDEGKKIYFSLNEEHKARTERNAVDLQVKKL